MRQSAQRAVVARRENRPVADDYRPDMLPRTGRTGRGLVSNAHEVFVPSSTHKAAIVAGSLSDRPPPWGNGKFKIPVTGIQKNLAAGNGARAAKSYLTRKAETSHDRAGKCGIAIFKARK